MKTSRIALFCLALVPLAAGFIQRSGSSTTATTSQVVSAAHAFLNTLSPAEKSKVTFAFNSSQRTAGWSNLPSGIFQRNGLRLGDLTQQQRGAALALVASATSRDGYQKITNIMNGDEV